MPEFLPTAVLFITVCNRFVSLHFHEAFQPVPEQLPLFIPFIFALLNHGFTFSSVNASTCSEQIFSNNICTPPYIPASFPSSASANFVFLQEENACSKKCFWMPSVSSPPALETPPPHPAEWLSRRFRYLS